MYSDELNKKQEVIEIDIHPVSKWRRILLFLGDFFIHFILGVIIMNLVVMPICSLFTSTDSDVSYAAQKNRDDVLYEYKLLFYKSPEDSSGSFKKYDFDSDLRYTYYRFLSYYVFDTEESINPDYPEYCHKIENEVIWTYYNDIRHDTITYYDLFDKLNQTANLFIVESNKVEMKQAVKDELKVWFKPGESLGSKGQEYFNSADELFSAIYGVVFQDIYTKDLVDSRGNSFVENQKVITQIANKYYATLAICSVISYVISWALVYVLYPLINQNRHTPTGSIMKIDRLAFKHLSTLSRFETFITSMYSLVLNLASIMFFSLSYTTFIYSLKIPALPIFSLISALVLLADLFIVLFNGFNRSMIDLLSQTVMVDTDEVDGIIKARETIKELELQNKRKGENS